MSFAVNEKNTDYYKTLSQIDLEKEFSIQAFLYEKYPNEQSVKLDYFNVKEILFNLYNLN